MSIVLSSGDLNARMSMVSQSAFRICIVYRMCILGWACLCIQQQCQYSCL